MIVQDVAATEAEIWDTHSNHLPQSSLYEQ